MNKMTLLSIIWILSFLLIISIGVIIFLVWQNNNTLLWKNKTQPTFISVDKEAAINITQAKKLKTFEDVKKFSEASSFQQIQFFIAIKEKNKTLWQNYWQYLFEKNNISKQDIENSLVKTWEVYDKIITNSLRLLEYSDTIQDGSIFFSNASIEEKKQACTTFFKDTKEKKQEFINYCIDNSYFYEALKNKEQCNNIKREDLRLNCKELLKN